MADIQTTGWGARLGKSLLGALVGVVLFFIAFPLLIWNEYKSVQIIRTLEAGAKQCLSVSADNVDPGNENKLVHVTGEATTPETLKDEQFGVSTNALKLTRKAEIYQWKERSESTTEKRAGGKEVTVTKYYHDKKWLDQPEPSANFHEDDATGELVENVGTLPYAKTDIHAKEPKLGAFRLTTAQVDDLDGKVPAQDKAMPATKEMLAALPKDLKGRDRLTAREGAFYLPYKAKTAAVPPPEGDAPANDKEKHPDEDTNEPQIGDVRVTFEVVKPQKISVLARQDNGSFASWQSSYGEQINDLRTGVQTKEQMFEQLQGENTGRTWMVRLIGFALMAGGVFLVCRPVAVIGDFLPMLGNLVEGVLLVFAVILALPLTLITIAITWVLVRPVFALSILAVGVLMLGGIIWLLMRRRAKSRMAAPKTA